MMSKKDWFLYIQKDWELVVLDISKLLEWSSLNPSSERPPRPEFKLVPARDGGYYKDGRPLTDMRCMIVDSKPYMVGGRLQDWSIFEATFETWANLQVIGCGCEEEEPCKLPNMSGPKFDPIVATLENKIYVMSSSIGEKDMPATFEVFDPATGSWRVLPNPPCGGGNFHYHCAWGHKLVVFQEFESRMYMFDTREEKWEDAYALLGILAEERAPPVVGLAQFNDFLIGICVLEGLEVIAYKLDSNGIPQPFQELVELQKVFRPYLKDYFASITHFGDDGLMCIVYYGEDRQERNLFCIRIVVFQLLVTSLHCGVFLLNADVKATENYYFRCPSFVLAVALNPVSITQDDFGKHDNKADASCSADQIQNQAQGDRQALQQKPQNTVQVVLPVTALTCEFSSKLIHKPMKRKRISPSQFTSKLVHKPMKRKRISPSQFTSELVHKPRKRQRNPSPRGRGSQLLQSPSKRGIDAEVEDLREALELQKKRVDELEVVAMQRIKDEHEKMRSENKLAMVCYRAELMNASFKASVQETIAMEINNLIQAAGFSDLASALFALRNMSASHGSNPGEQQI